MGLADQNQEGRLKGVVRVLRIAQDTPADTEYQIAVPLQNGGESPFLTGLAEAFEEIGIRRVARACA